MSFERRLIAAAAAMLLAVVTVMPLLIEARHETSAAGVTTVVTIEAGHAPDGGQADELIHHAQSHEQGVMPSTAAAPLTGIAAAVAFTAEDGRDGDLGTSRGPFEPPRA